MVYRDIVVYTFTYDPASIAANTTAEDTVTVTGLDASDEIVLSITKPTLTAGVGIVNARISADNTLAVTWVNSTAGAVDPASETYMITVARSSTDPTANGDRL